MELRSAIPAEVLQLLSAAEASEYQLVPYEDGADGVRCYGAEGVDHGAAAREIEALVGRSVRVTGVPAEELRQLIVQCYRREEKTRVSEISSGQGFLTSLIGEAFRDYASDIHFEPYESRCRVRLRIDGRLAERYVIEPRRYAPLVNQVKILAGLDIAERRLPQDGRIAYNREGQKFDVRVSCLPTLHGEKVVLRLLTRHAELLELDNLGFSERQLRDYTRAIARPFGMVLICGPTESGKSTTLYATLRRLNNTADNILTIEDPVEYTLEGVNQVALKEEIGLTFPSALRTFLRQDPDVIMLGEIRDPETAQMAIRSSLTGHLLFSTLHTNTAWGAVERLVDMGVHPWLVADTLAASVAQRLVRLFCPHCKRPVGDRFEAVGCERCFYTGYSGRRAVYEVIPMDAGLAAAARAGTADVEAMLRERGVVPLREGVEALLRRGETSLEELTPLL